MNDSFENNAKQNHNCMQSMSRWDCLPSNVIEIILSNVSLSDLLSCHLVCRKWYHILKDENCDVWRIHCLNKLSKAILKSDVLSSLSSYKAKLRAYFYAWDPNDCSRNIYIKPNGFTLHRNPVAQSIQYY
jgi:F-box protein 45